MIMINQPSFSDQVINLVVIIVNYQTPDLTINCLQSLISEINAQPDVKVVVADNNSGDESLAKIQTAINIHGWKNWATLMPLKQNGGYAFGNNAVIKHFLNISWPPTYFWLLNSDTIVRPGALKALLDFMNENLSVGIAGSRLEDPDSTPQRSAFRFHTIYSELDSALRLGIISKLLERWIVAPPVPANISPTDWIPGASMIIRSQVLAEIGLMDEEYFMYYEDSDFCLKAKKHGWSCWYVPTSKVVHLVGQSSQINNQQTEPKRRPQYWFNSRQHYFVKNHGWWYAILVDLVWIISFSIWKIRSFIQRRPNYDPPNFFRDFLRHSIFLKGV